VSLSLAVPERRPRAPWPWLATAGGLALVAWSAVGTQADLTVFLRRDTVADVSGFVTRMLPPDLSRAFMHEVGSAVLETFAISIVGTLLAVVIAAALAFFATRTIVFEGVLYARGDLGWQWYPRFVLYASARAVLSLLRTVPEIAWALIFVFAVGLGPFPGVLALGVHTGGVLGKLFGEVLEDVPPQPVEALQACGASRISVIAYGILPQALPQFLAYALYRWEVNIRAAAVLGFVGAGGLGQQIHVAMSLFLERRLLTLVLAIYVIVTVVDAFSTLVRRKLR
jgi:phosphonate transport system permease protein